MRIPVTHEQERIRHQIIGSPQFLLQEWVLLERKRSGKITRLHWEIFAADEVGLDGMVGRQTMQQSPEANEIVEAGCVLSGGCCSLSQRNRVRR